MANSNTEHSKALRAKTAQEWQCKQREEGKKKQISMLVETEIADAFTQVSQALGLSKPQTLKRLIEFYQNNQ